MRQSSHQSVRSNPADGMRQGAPVGLLERAVLPGAIAAAALLAVGAVVQQSLSPEPIMGFGITIDRLSSALVLLVALVGAVTYRFAFRALEGHPHRSRFMRLLAASVVCASLLMCSTNLVLLFVAWFLTSAGLHALLTFCKDRPEAERPARKKFLISRLGDAALIAAIALIWVDHRTLDLNVYLDALRAGDSTDALPIALLVALAALTKSAQFPFHSWLPETMEAPTPVSALMHAGIINAGGALLIRFAPLIAVVPESWFMLSVVGTATFALGLVATWAQVKAKRSLAFSTVSQMGFMMVQCGLCAFPAAFLHIIGHGLYKAWAFLRIGEVPKPQQAPAATGRALALLAIGTLCAVPALALASLVTGFSPMHSPGELALAAIVAISIGQLWVAMLGRTAIGTGTGALRAVSALALTVVLSITAFALYHGTSLFLSPVLGDIAVAGGALAWIAAAVPVIALAALVVLHAMLPNLQSTQHGRALHVHALHGFYFGSIADRFVDAVWRTKPRPRALGQLSRSAAT